MIKMKDIIKYGAGNYEHYIGDPGMSRIDKQNELYSKAMVNQFCYTNVRCIGNC